MRRSGLDDGMIDRLLAGHVAPEDAPSGYGAIAAAIRAARQPATEAELAQHATVVPAIAAAIRANPLGVPGRVARRRRLGRRFGPKVATVTSALVLLGAGAAAATGSLPSGIQQTVSDAAHDIGVSIPSGTAGHSGHTPANGHASVTTLTPQSPEIYGLCQAFGTPATNVHSGKDNSVAYQRLAALAHGQTVADFCKPVLANGPNGSNHPSPSHPTPAPHQEQPSKPDNQSTGAPGTQTGTGNGNANSHADGSGSGHGAGASHHS